MQIELNDLLSQIKESDERIKKLEDEINLNAKKIKELNNLLDLFINKLDIKNDFI
jgi:peptidoglycan hydrolase CwlO-like protein